jgi:hypothetical protein
VIFTPEETTPLRGKQVCPLEIKNPNPTWISLRPGLVVPGYLTHNGDVPYVRKTAVSHLGGGI